MNTLSLFVAGDLGIHARPAAVLAYVQANFFPSDTIILVDRTQGRDALMGCVLDVMMLCSAQGHHVEFLAVLESQPFRDLALILKSLTYILEAPRRLEYSECIRCVTHFRGDRPGAIAALLQQLAQPNRHPFFAEALPTVRPPLASFQQQDFQLAPDLLRQLESIDPLACEDALRASTKLYSCDISGLLFIRRSLERLTGFASKAAQLPASHTNSLSDRIGALSKALIIDDLDTQLLTFLRTLGNKAAHAGGQPDSHVLPDQEAARFVFHAFARGLAQIIVAIRRQAKDRNA